MDYKEILEGVVNIINTTEKSDIGFVNICAYIGENCPELAEQEDERIKKEIINYFQCQSRDEPTRKDVHNKWIAWLEKQGKKKSEEEVDNLHNYLYGEQRPAWSEKDEYVYNEILKRVADKKLYEHDLEYIYNWLKSLRPQNRWKPSDHALKLT